MVANDDVLDDGVTLEDYMFVGRGTTLTSDWFRAR